MPIWRRITGRGYGFFFVGIVLSALAASFGQRQILIVTLFVTLLPLVALALGLLEPRPRVTYRRQLIPARTVPRSQVIAHLAIEKPARWSTTVWRFMDQLPTGSELAPQVEVTKPIGRWRRNIAYALDFERRGAYLVGPLLLERADPFGVSGSVSVLGSPSELLVEPKVHQLGALQLGRGAAQPTDRSPEVLGNSDNDDVLIREHRHGDGARRVHWRASAKHGQLMVRREEESKDSSVQLLLDNRCAAWPDPEGFEWAVSAVASAALAALSGGSEVRLIDATGLLCHPTHRDEVFNRDSVLTALAKVELTETPTLDTAAKAAPGGGHWMTLAVFGRLEADSATALLATGAGRRQGLLCGPVDPAVREALEANGWRTSAVPQGMAIAAAWAELGSAR